MTTDICVFQGGHGFWDEKGEFHGPYPDERFARMMLSRHRLTLNGYSPYLLVWSEAQRRQIDLLLQTSPSAAAKRKVADSVVKTTCVFHVSEKVYGREPSWMQRLLSHVSALALASPIAVQGHVRI